MRETVLGEFHQYFGEIRYIGTGMLWPDRCPPLALHSHHPVGDATSWQHHTVGLFSFDRKFWSFSAIQLSLILVQLFCIRRNGQDRGDARVDRGRTDSVVTRFHWRVLR